MKKMFRELVEKKKTVRGDRMGERGEGVVKQKKKEKRGDERGERALS